MSVVNQVIIQGRLVKDPEWKESIKLCRFGLASNSVCIDKKTGKPIVNFIWFSAFNKLGQNICKCARKGMQVIVVGSLEVRKWRNDKTGEFYENFYVNANEITYLDKINNSKEIEENTGLEDLPIPETLDDSELPSESADDINDTLPF